MLITVLYIKTSIVDVLVILVRANVYASFLWGGSSAIATHVVTHVPGQRPLRPGQLPPHPTIQNASVLPTRESEPQRRIATLKHYCGNVAKRPAKCS